MELLPAAIYQSPSRQGRRGVLNTIVEEQREGSSGSSRHESGTDTDEGTVIYNPLSPKPANTMAGMVGQMFTRPVLASVPRDKEEQRQSVDSDAETEFSDSFTFSDTMSSRPTSFATESTRSSVASTKSSKNRYPAIIIPSNILPPSILTPLKSATVPLTPSAKIAVSPAALSMLSRCLPNIHAPPSLDGSSMTSDHVSNISAPATPDTRNLQISGDWDQHPIHLQRDGYSESGDNQSDILIEQPIDWDEVGLFPRIPGATPQDMSPIEPDIRGLGVLTDAISNQGVMLPAGALQTLSQLEPARPPNLGSDISQNDQTEMRESLKPGPFNRRHSLDCSIPSSASDCLSPLSVPSPGGFFSSLKSGTRHTWFPNSNIKSNPPSSATAENFYNAPWNLPTKIVEQVVEINDDVTEGPETARTIFSFDEPPTAKQFEPPDIPTDQDSANGTDSAPESAPDSIETVKERPKSPIRYEYEEEYESELLEHAAVYLDRTSTWLAAQSSYLAALRETNPVNDVTEPLKPSKDVIDASKEVELVKKGVRFIEAEKVVKDDSFELCQRKEHAYYHAFQHLEKHSRKHDSFSRRTSRFEAVQASRIALGSEHVDQLRGKYQVQEPSRPKYCGPFSQNPRATGLSFTSQQLEFLKVEREKGVLDQASASFWVVDALKYLNGGNLLLSSATKRLNAAKPAEPSEKPHKRVRALDLGGNTSCDWAWHCARQYPYVETCTVVVSTENTNTSVTGPWNHSLVTAPQLWKLPFPKNYFDLISARSLHALLKKETAAGDDEIDEYDLCLRECYRVLKPGGYLEFLVMDSDMTQPGPLANAMSVEFGFKLKTRGYDPFPTKPFLQRLRNARMVDIKRAWTFMPAGSPTQESRPARETPFPVPTSTEGAEAVHGPVGSTANVGNVTGLLGSWMWEQWMLKLQTETGVEKDKLLKGMAAVLEESRNCGAGWRCLSGWARKPPPSKKNKSKPKPVSIANAKALPIRMTEQPSSPPPTEPLPNSPLGQSMVKRMTAGNGRRHVKAPSAETIHIKIEGMNDMGAVWF